MSPAPSTSSASTDLHDPSSQVYKKARRQYLKTTRNRNHDPDINWTPFRTAEKRYKARFPPPDLSDVLDLATLDNSRAEEVMGGGWFGRPDAVECKQIQLSNSDAGRKAYIIPRIPGAGSSLCNTRKRIQFNDITMLIS